MRGAAADVKRYFAEGLRVLAVGAAGLFSSKDHDRVADWVVGVVAPAGADCAESPILHKLDPPPGDDVDALIGPVRLDKVRFPLPLARCAAGEVGLDVRAERAPGVIGANGSGKTTLMLFGRPGTVGHRGSSGTVGFWELGGTAVVLQHPESRAQVAGDGVGELPLGTLR